MPDKVTKATITTQEGVTAKLIQNWPGMSYEFYSVIVDEKEVDISQAIAILIALLKVSSEERGEQIAQAVTKAETERGAPSTPINRNAAFTRLLQAPSDPSILHQALAACLTPAIKQSIMDAYWNGMEARALRGVHADREIHELKASRQGKEVA